MEGTLILLTSAYSSVLLSSSRAPPACRTGRQRLGRLVALRPCTHRKGSAALWELNDRPCSMAHLLYHGHAVADDHRVRVLRQHLAHRLQHPCRTHTPHCRQVSSAAVITRTRTSKAALLTCRGGSTTAVGAEFASDAPQLRTASASKLYTFRTPITAVRRTYGCRSFRPRWIGDICTAAAHGADTGVPVATSSSRTADMGHEHQSASLL